MSVTAQFTLTAQEAKRLIALCVFQTPQFQTAFTNHRVVFKGSTTVSALSQLAVDTPLRICGRMTETGMRANGIDCTSAHTLLWEHGTMRNIDDDVEDVLKSFTPDDLFIIGANAIDVHGNAALLIGSAGGGGYGHMMGAMYTEGFQTLILATSDKLIAGNLQTLYSTVYRKHCDYAYGMACGLAPVHGTVITEVDAISKPLLWKPSFLPMVGWMVPLVARPFKYVVIRRQWTLY